MSEHDHDHHHDHDHSELSETQLRVRALETVLTEKGYVDPAALDLLIETYEKKVGPRNGARVVAFALTLAMGMPGGWNIDMSRFARENRPPAEYLSMSYYQIWFAALETHG
jgi:Nitrile hydratase beta subunit/Nitrile hydratase, alpha chain